MTFIILGLLLIILLYVCNRRSYWEQHNSKRLVLPNYFVSDLLTTWKVVIQIITMLMVDKLTYYSCVSSKRGNIYCFTPVVKLLQGLGYLGRYALARLPLGVLQLVFSTSATVAFSRRGKGRTGPRYSSDSRLSWKRSWGCLECASSLPARCNSGTSRSHTLSWCDRKWCFIFGLRPEIWGYKIWVSKFWMIY